MNFKRYALKKIPSHPIIYIFRFDAKIKQDSIYEFKRNKQLPQTQSYQYIAHGLNKGTF